MKTTFEDVMHAVRAFALYGERQNISINGKDVMHFSCWEFDGETRAEVGGFWSTLAAVMRCEDGTRLVVVQESTGGAKENALARRMGDWLEARGVLVLRAARLGLQCCDRWKYALILADEARRRYCFVWRAVKRGEYSRKEEREHLLRLLDVCDAVRACWPSLFYGIYRQRSEAARAMLTAGDASKEARRIQRELTKKTP